ncbi:MAG: ketose-bisphosphate aldolase [Armatimonadota bacterium]
MPLVTSGELMKDAMEREYAVGAFNAINLETAQAIMAAAHAENSPLILQVTQTTIAYTDPEPLVACIHDLISKSTIPVALHLDHGRSFEIVMRFLLMRFSSVMMDGSLQPDGNTPRTLEENLEVTRKAVEAAHAVGVSTEGEIGRLGQVSDDESEDVLTDPEEAAQFVEATGVDLLAVAIGTTHGLYKGTPKIYTDRVAEIRDRTNMPLVMHGGTGVPDEDVVAGIKNGIRKVNIDTQMRVAAHDALWKIMNEIEGEYKEADAAGDPRKYDIRRILAPARDAIQEVVAEKMRLFGCAGKA